VNGYTNKMSETTAATVFELFGVYFANCFWNHLYESALGIWQQEQYENIDEAYRTTIKRYNLGFCQRNSPNEKINQNYIRIIKDVYHNYKDYLNSADTYFGFIDTVVKFLIPNDYYSSMSSHDPRKDSIFRDIMCKSLTKFTLYVMQDGVKDVVDPNIRRKQAAEKLKTWKDKYVNLLTAERNSFCSLLLAKTSGVNIQDPSEIPTIPKEVLDKLSSKLQTVIEEKAKLARERNQYARLCKVYKEHIQSLQTAAQHAGGVVTVPTGGVVAAPTSSVVAAPAAPAAQSGRVAHAHHHRHYVAAKPVPAEQAMKNEEYSSDSLEDTTPDIVEQKEEFLPVADLGELKADE
jgi:hypothetical protein